MTKAAVFIQIGSPIPPGPAFSAERYEVSVPESAAAGSVLFTASLEATPPAGYLVYSLLNGTDTFQIDSGTGAVRLKKQLDHEKARQYTVPVVVRSHSLLPPLRSATATFVVSVENENDNPPVFERASYTAVVMEFDRRLNREIATVWAVDPDDPAAPVYYTIEPESALFQVDSARGVISNLKELSREAIAGGVRQHQLTVRAMDPADPSLYSDVPVLVVVEGRNEFAPRCSPGSFVFSISAHAPAGMKEKCLFFKFFFFRQRICL